MTQNVRATPQTVKVLRAVLSCPRDGMCGSQIAQETGLASGSLYPILMRLESAGLLESEWEEQTPSELKRPRRRFYRISALGAKAVREMIAQTEDVGRGVEWAWLS